MLTLTKSLFALMIGFIISTMFGVILIPFLKKIKADQRINVYVDAHKRKAGTPTMGGFIFIVPCLITVLLLLFTGKMEYSINLFIILFVMISYGMIGFMDDYISLKNNTNRGLTQIQKLFLQFIVAVVFYILFRHFGDGDSVLRVTFFSFEWNLSWFYGAFILFLLVGTSNAVNLTDGLDGLAGGLSAISFLAYGLIAWGSYWISGYQDIGIFCFILVGCIMGFLVFNSSPAKVFMGDTGSLALGATLATVAILTSHEFSLAVIGGIFVIETLSVIIQIFSVVVFKKKVFLMSPIHHHFERLGWREGDIVKLFWIGGFILGLLALIYGVWL
ncbi:MAG: phospho-N-acetylmuramoyl-pentapeptide-transferase [Bacilli bacterium]|nr:phospho-N-acetylmuramoyl-pentapeptide-transferase [Bacilli bacterium]